MAAVRIRLRNVPLERDEGEYAYSGQLILQGIPPYKLASNMKFPGMYLAYAAIMSIFGQTSTGIHLGFMLVNAADIIFVYLLATRLTDRAVGITATAIYAYGSLSGAFVGIWAHATHFVLLFALPGLLLLLRDNGRGKILILFLSGTLLGACVLMKQHGATFVAFAGCYLIYIFFVARDWKKLGRSLAFFSIGVCFPLLATGLWLWKSGVFKNFWFWTIQYASTYASAYRGPTVVWYMLSFYTPSLIWFSLILTVPGIYILWLKYERRAFWFIAGFLAASILATIPGFRFTWHYFILPLPALAMMVAVVTNGLAHYARPHVPQKFVLIPFIVLAVILAISVLTEEELFFQCKPERATRMIYGPLNPFGDAVKIAQYLEQHSQTNDQIAILGSEPEIYFYSRRHSATSYIYTYALMEPQPYALQMQKEMIGEIEKARPEYLVYVTLKPSWARSEDSHTEIFGWITGYTYDYDVVGVINMGTEESQFFWDKDAPDHEQNADIIVYKRKPVHSPRPSA